jgi:hypothetical protein
MQGNSLVASNFDNKTVTRNYMLEQKQSELNYQFSERQKEYETMMKGPPVQEIDFRLIEPDKPIENMDELLKQHMKSRAEISNKTMDAATIENVVIVLDEPSASPLKLEPKKVHWTEPLVERLIETEPNEGTKHAIELTAFMKETREFMETTRTFMLRTLRHMNQSTTMDMQHLQSNRRRNSF